MIDKKAKTVKIMKSNPMTRLKLAAALSLIILILIVIFQNTEPVETRILFFTIVMSRAALLATTMLIGVAIGILISFGLTKWMSKKD